MRRREFLKLAGVVAASPTCLCRANQEMTMLVIDSPGSTIERKPLPPDLFKEYQRLEQYEEIIRNFIVYGTSICCIKELPEKIGYEIERVDLTALMV